MSTRGVYGFVINGQSKLGVSPSDAYPHGLGTDVLVYLANHTDSQIIEQAKSTQMVRKNEEYFEKALLNQGNLSCSYLIDGTPLMGNGLFCEWAYILNTDNKTLEVYSGFCEKDKAKGRYAFLSDKPQKVTLLCEISWHSFRKQAVLELQHKNEPSLSFSFISKVASSIEQLADLTIHDIKKPGLANSLDILNKISTEPCLEFKIPIKELPAGTAFKVAGDPFVYIKLLSSENNCAYNKQTYALKTFENNEFADIVLVS